MDPIWYPLDLADCTLEPTARPGGVESSHDSPLEGAFEVRVFEPLAQHAEQTKLLAFDPPGRADAQVAQLGRLVGGIPALHDAVEALRPILLAPYLDTPPNKEPPTSQK